ncbi:MAG: zinc ABC transporter substrate-binding protein [Anaerolineae bacterium]|nr:zinc ABC transporter substrate-binding protein [Anaerolineae bacterium]
MARSRLHTRLALVLGAVLMALVTAGCTAEPEAGPADGKLAVTVSVVPQQYFVERIGGEHVAVTVMVGPGDNPTTYEPKPAQLKALSRSAAYFSVGVPFESVWLDRIAGANPDMRIVDTIEDIERHLMVTHDDHEGEEGTEAVGAPDPHVWVSPELVKIQARTIYGAMAELDPDNAATYRANLDAFLADIDGLIAEIHGTLAGVADSKFMVFHPSWGYFAEDFGMEQVPIEIGGQEPSAQEMAHLVREARAEGIRVIFAQPEFSTVDAETIAKEIGGEVLLISPLAYDWLENLQTVANTFAEVLAE